MVAVLVLKIWDKDDSMATSLKGVPELLRKVEAMQTLLLQQGESLKLLDGRTARLEKRTIADDAAKKAVAEYKQQEGRDTPSTLNTKVILALVGAIGAITTVVLIISQRQWP